ncbi:MAG: hypothetical protein AAF607_01470 [Pseudomonadota bacterium]
MGRDTHVYAIDYVVKIIDEDVDLLLHIAANPDNIDYGEMIDVAIGPEEHITAFTSHGIESLKEFIADIRTWPGGIRQFLTQAGCDPKIVEKICRHEPR